MVRRDSRDRGMKPSNNERRPNSSRVIVPITARGKQEVKQNHFI
jgi:hypothetical protein